MNNSAYSGSHQVHVLVKLADDDPLRRRYGYRYRCVDCNTHLKVKSGIMQADLAKLRKEEPDVACCGVRNQNAFCCMEPEGHSGPHKAEGFCEPWTDAEVCVHDLPRLAKQRKEGAQ